MRKLYDDVRLKIVTDGRSLVMLHKLAVKSVEVHNKMSMKSSISISKARSVISFRWKEEKEKLKLEREKLRGALL